MALTPFKLAALCLLLVGNVAVANDQRAHNNYMIHCQGCHLPDASGHPGKVPAMNNFVGLFWHSEAGRQFVVQVPGAATSTIADAELAELLNWVARTFSAAELPGDFKPLSAAEVGRWREHPEHDPERRRARVLDDIAKGQPALAQKIANEDQGSLH